MAIKGSLKEASLPDVLQLLAMGGKTGCLAVSHKSNFGYIYFDKGRICYASIVNRRDRLGDILVKSGVVSQAQLDEAIAAQTPQRDRRVGDILVAQGAIAREELHRQIKVQIEEAVYFLFTWSQGSFTFEADVAPDEQDFLVNINPESLLLEGARRVDEWSLIEKKIPSFDIIFELDRGRLEHATVELSAEQEALLPLIDGRRDIVSLVDDSGLVEFDVGKALFGLITAGFLHRVGVSKAAQPAVPDARVEEHRNLGVAFYKTGMLEEAMREFRRVIDLREGDAASRFFVGLVLMKQGRWPDAVATFREASVLPGAKAAVFHNLAYGLERLGRFGEAKVALDEASKRGGAGDPRTLVSLAVIALRHGELGAAEERLMAARPLWGRRPVPASWFHYAGLVAALGGDLERAASVLVEGIGVHPHAAALHNNLAVIHERRGQYDDAVAAAERGAQEDSAVPQLHKNLGDYSYRRGQYDAAQESYLRAVKASPSHGADVYLKLGNIRYRQHAHAEAVAYWERALELDPENGIIRSNLDAVRRTLQAAG